jgi:Secretion system C-terminal sorting domain
MKKIYRFTYLAIILSILINVDSFSQTFTATVDHTTLSDVLGSEIIFEFDVTNNSSSETTFCFLRETKVLPDGWSSSLCFSYCFSPFQDSIVTNELYGSSPFAAGESRKISFHVFPATTEGEANFDIIIANLDIPSESQMFNLTATTNLVSVKGDENFQSFKLYQNFPNPFNPSTKISFELKESGNAKIAVFDILGNEVDLLTDKYYTKGYYELDFSANNLSSGIYFYKLESNNLVQVKKMIVGK